MKTAAITTIVIICVIAIGIGVSTLFGKKPMETGNEETVPAKEPSPEITVNINTEEPTQIYEEIVDDETGETVTAEVQENVPPSPKQTSEPPKPKAEGNYENPEAPPEYTKEQTIVEKNDAPSQPKEEINTQPKNGQVYVEGFGYIDVGADTVVENVDSGGDINKIVGNMD